MRFEVITSKISNLTIQNKFEIPGIVLIFPITRSSGATNECWKNFVHLIENSELHAVVIIDKTDLHIATEFFVNEGLDLDCDCYILQREPSEGIFDSQRILKLDPNLWIVQLHDDDNWSGKLSLPAKVSKETIYVPEIQSDNYEYSLAESIRVPAHSLFSLTPDSLWNSFTDYIDAQGGHIAPSADSSLNLIARRKYNYKRLTGFKYSYSARHWDNKKRIGIELRKLSTNDGWGPLSGSTAAVLVSHLDRICFSIFHANRDGEPHNQANMQAQIEEIASSNKSKILQFIPEFVDFNAFKILRNNRGNMHKGAWSSCIYSAVGRIWLALEVSKIHNLDRLNELLKRIQSMDISESLNLRLEYWTATLLKTKDI